MTYQIEFGRSVNGKYVRDFALERDSWGEAKTLLHWASGDLRMDAKNHQALRTEVRMTSEKGTLYHYITAFYPEVVLPSRSPE